MAATTTTTTSEPTGTEKMVRPKLPSAVTNAQLTNRPMPRPMKVPRIDISTASQRTVERSCDRLMPTARNRPSSRVRSWMDNASVLAIPIIAMITLSRSMA